MENQSSPKKISLKSADGIVFEVEPSITKEMKIVQSFIEDDNASTTDAPIPLPNVFSPQLSMIVDYLHQHSKGKSESNEFDAEFLMGVSNDDLRELILAVHYLNIDDLLDFLTMEMADRIKNKSVEYVRRLFGVKNDYTPEEEAKLREENAWTFRGVDEDDDE